MKRKDYDSAVALLEQLIESAAEDIPFTLMDKAPETFEGIKEYLAQHGRLAIYSEGSDKTIYSSPEINHRFRALHDKTHIEYGLGFSVADELKVAGIQAEFFERMAWNRGRDNLAGAIHSIIMVEVYTQRVCTEITGLFVSDQKAFALRFLGVEQ